MHRASAMPRGEIRMGRFVIVAYKPKPGQEHGLEAVVANYVPLATLAETGRMFAEFDAV